MAKPKPPQSKIGLRDYFRSRRKWKPDWEELEKEMEQINKELWRKHKKPPINA